jgi:hypothetical protein
VHCCEPIVFLKRSPRFLRCLGSPNQGLSLYKKEATCNLMIQNVLRVVGMCGLLEVQSADCWKCNGQT